MKKIYTIENIDCANCAAKIESMINKLPEVEEATITFATKQLRVSAENPDSLVGIMTEIANAVENGVVIRERKKLTVKKNTCGTVCSCSRSCCGENGHEHHEDECGECSQSEEKVKAKAKLPKLTDMHFIAAGIVLFAAGIFSQQYSGKLSLGLFAAAYLVLGGEILLTAVKNIGKGQIFDENFLMSIATIGAFAIGEYPEAVGVMLFFRIGEFFEEKAVERSRSQIMEAVDMRPEVVNIVAEGTDGSFVREIAAENAEVGNIILVRPGDRIPLDGIVIEGESRVDTSPVTGEPVPVRVKEGSRVVSGGINTSGVLKVKVEKALEDSMVTRILDSVENAAASKPKIDKFITRFARIYTPFVVFLALATAVIPSVVTGEWEHWIYTALTFLVISCPCALVLSVPLAFFAGIGAGSKKGVLFKSGAAIEALKGIKTVVMDKTGTVTEGNFKVQNVICTGNLFSYLAENKEEAKGISKDEVEKYLIYVAACCEYNSTHPIGASIIEAAEQSGIVAKAPDSVEETAGRGITARLDGNEVLCGSRGLLESRGVETDGYTNPTAGTEVLLAIDGKFMGALIIADVIKKDSKDAVTKMKRMGIATAMLTGDGRETAEAVSKALGIEHIFFKLLPDEKLNALQELRKKLGAVMYVGDGINDAPVLAGADVGAAMGSGADAAIEAADVVFMTSNLEAVPQAISIAKTTGRIAIQNVVFALMIKAAVMVLGLAGIASMWMAVFADSGVAMLCVINSVRILYKKF